MSLIYKFFSCLLCFSLVTGGAGGAVLCICEEGEAHLDTAFHAACGDDVESDCHLHEMDDSEDQACLEHEHEKHCIDIPLAFGILKPTTSVQFGIQTILCVIPAAESSRDLNSESIALDLIPPNNPSLCELTTVILLT